MVAGTNGNLAPTRTKFSVENNTQLRTATKSIEVENHTTKTIF